MSPYKSLFIDWHNTLSTSLFWGHLQDPAHPHHHLFRMLQPLPSDIQQTLFTPWMRGQVTSEEVIHAIAKKLNLDYHLIWQEFIRSCQSMQLLSAEIPSLISTIRARGVKVVIATNNTDSFSRWTVPSLKLHEVFDAILNSADAKSLKWEINEKGQSLFFADFLQRQDIHPGESALIDDNNSEMARERTRLFGIEYRRIEPQTGLILELRGIIASLHEEA
jgi:FMN phosphatase YigB (HAD superfamily)